MMHCGLDDSNAATRRPVPKGHLHPMSEAPTEPGWYWVRLPGSYHGPAIYLSSQLMEDDFAGSGVLFYRRLASVLAKRGEWI